MRDIKADCGKIALVAFVLAAMLLLAVFPEVR